MKIALIQMNAVPDRAANLRQAEDLMYQALAAGKPDLIVLPEHFDWIGGTAQDKIEAADRVPGGAAFEMLRRFSRDHAVWIHAGSLLEHVAETSTTYNSSIVFDDHGRMVGRYRKIHLFDITTPDGKVYQESASVAAGDRLLVYDIGNVRIGCAICYDLRFSRLFDRLADCGVDIFILPAAFTRQTGRDHWEVLCRARAIEFQSYLVACGQCGSYPSPDGSERLLFGHSLVCDPWGKILNSLGDMPGVLTVDVDTDRLADVRRRLPMKSQRRSLDDLPVDVGRSFGCVNPALCPCGQVRCD
ncbi:carbon-nitrogen hydrolase family protein [Rhizobium halophytocola]|uniref:Nitrilase n=1 Tax=Rhizobium halophytocola TaxID=735519 RepID=A0ABS4E4D8_9HYPH|nr:carbon-nitrogen hydrolase family protein [Rhizobium halophytocola]MBP1852813.1 nitrilase [Rhizobium halophytocola]